MKSNKGYSLIEIAIGLTVFTLLIFCVGAIANAAFSNYRIVQYRNKALEIAMNKIESILISDDAPGFTTKIDDLNEELPFIVTTTIENVLVENSPSHVYLVKVSVGATNDNANKLGLPLELETLKVVREGAN